MTLHRTFSRWSETAELVPEWMWWAHLGLGAAAGVAVLVRWDAPLWLALATWLLTTTALTLGLFRRATVLPVAFLGGAAMTAAGAAGLGLLLAGVLTRVMAETTALYVGMLIGAALGATIAVSSYRPFIRRVRG